MIPSVILIVYNQILVVAFKPISILLNHKLKYFSAWLQNCNSVDGFYERYPQGPRLVIGIVRSAYKGNYTCIVTFKDHGRTYNLTRTIKMKVVGKNDFKMCKMHVDSCRNGKNGWKSLLQDPFVVVFNLHYPSDLVHFSLLGSDLCDCPEHTAVEVSPTSTSNASNTETGQAQLGEVQPMRWPGVPSAGMWMHNPGTPARGLLCPLLVTICGIVPL